MLISRVWFDGPGAKRTLRKKTLKLKQQVDSGVASQTLSASELFIQDGNGDLWLDQGRFDGTVPRPRRQADVKVGTFQALSASEVLVQARTATYGSSVGHLAARSRRRDYKSIETSC
jgi:hypothetical protein